MKGVRARIGKVSSGMNCRNSEMEMEIVNLKS